MNSKVCVLAMALCLIQVATSMPGFGGPFGMGGFGPMAGGAGGFGPMAGGAGGFGPMAGGPGGFGMYNKQMGMSFGLIGMTTKTAKNEVKSALDLVKLIASIYPAENECAAGVQTTIDEIDTELMTAFDVCDPKADMMNLRMQAMAMKQQQAAYKMGKKQCKVAVDPLACMTELNEAMPQAPADGITDVITKNGDCVTDVKEGLLTRIVDASNELKTC